MTTEPPAESLTQTLCSFTHPQRGGGGRRREEEGGGGRRREEAVQEATPHVRLSKRSVFEHRLTVGEKKTLTPATKCDSAATRAAAEGTEQQEGKQKADKLGGRKREAALRGTK